MEDVTSDVPVLWLSLLAAMILSGFAGRYLWDTGFVSAMFLIPGVLAVILSIVGIAVTMIAAFTGSKDIAATWYCAALFAGGWIYCEIGMCLGLLSDR